MPNSTDFHLYGPGDGGSAEDPTVDEFDRTMIDICLWLIDPDEIECVSKL